MSPKSHTLAHKGSLSTGTAILLAAVSAIEAAPPAPPPPGTPGPGFESAIARTPRDTDETGFQALLTGDAARQWRQCGPGRFELSHGVATGEGGMGLWWYAGRPFTNFVIRGEFLQEQPIADSGLFVRFPDPGQDPWVAVHHGHEMEIGDPEPEDPTWRTGSIYPYCASRRANTLPPGHWNTFQFVAVGQHYAVWINGERVTEWTDPKARTTHGFVGLQNYDDGKKVRHRNLRIRELP